jgi:lysophospholipase L1-like esterase
MKGGRRGPGAPVLVAVNSILLVVLLHVFEGVARLMEPARGLPPNGGDYTWGHLVTNNRLGFRERDFPLEKPQGTLRVMALGDSLTWGVGVEDGLRYTALLERDLAGLLPQSLTVEVLNFGVVGASTGAEWSTLERLGDRVQPDVVVVGYCLNDPQVRGQDWSPEREGLGLLLSGLPLHPDEAGLSATARRVRQAVFALAERLALVPTWVEALDRAYAPASKEWQGFLQALEGIAAHCRTRGLPPPVFAVLSQYRRAELGYLGEVLGRWYSQAARAAAARGYTVVEFERRIDALPAGTPLAVNAADGHPSADLHRVYAQGLAEPVATALERRAREGAHR